MFRSGRNGLWVIWSEDWEWVGVDWAEPEAEVFNFYDTITAVITYAFDGSCR